MCLIVWTGKVGICRVKVRNKFGSVFEFGSWHPCGSVICAFVTKPTDKVEEIALFEPIVAL